jgi:hypothetical protein
MPYFNAAVIRTIRLYCEIVAFNSGYDAEPGLLETKR